MIISRTPMRVSFVGGGSDLPAFYREFGGAVVSTSINKYVYIAVNPKFDNEIRVSYSRTEEVRHVEEIQHGLVREVLAKLKIVGGVEITSISDIPSRGTGMGTSSAFTVGLLHALHAFKGKYVSSERLAQESCDVEINKCSEPIGKQDQYAAAYGGLNLIQFNKDETVNVEPIICHSETLKRLQRNLLFFYTGITRSASKLLKEQSNIVESDAGKQQTVRKMVQLAYTLQAELQKDNIDAFGEILHENWLLKKSILGEISSSSIDRWYDQAMTAGATGGKVLGAGAGGFLAFFVPPKKRKTVIDALAGLRPVDLRFENAGSKIIFYQ